MPDLVVAYLDGTEERYTLTDQEVLIGRDTQLMVSIPDSKISRRHARMFLRRGSWFIEDLGSVNGVIVDGVRITHAVPCPLGQNLHVGDAVLRVVPSVAEHAARAQAREQPKMAAATSWLLQVTEGPLKGLKLTVSGPGPKVLGRDGQADLTVADSSVSRRHARMTAGRSELAIEDLGSSNGTFLLGQPIKQGMAKHADTLRFGNVTMTVRQERQASASEPQTARGEPHQIKANLLPNKTILRGSTQSPMRRSALVLMAVVGLAFAAVAVAKMLDRKPQHRNDGTRPKAHANAASQPQATSIHEQPAQPASKPHLLSDTHASISDETHNIEMPNKLPSTQNPKHQGKLERAWASITGLGPSAQERAFKLALAALYDRALALSRGTEPQQALTALRELLQKDPLHHKGRKLLTQLLVHQKEADALHAAQAAMQGGQALTALSVVSAALDQKLRPSDDQETQTEGNKPAPSTEALELAAVGEQAAATLGQACGERAQAACMAQAWAACIAQVACLLGYQPNAAQGLALLALASDAVGGVPQGATALRQDGSALVPPTLQAAQDAVAQFTSLYPQMALRQAVMVYGTGDLAAASQRLRPLTCPQCRSVGGWVRQVATGLPRARQLRDSGQHEAATALYDVILRADRKLCPEGTPSVLRTVALEGKQAVFLAQGSAAFERGAYKEALEAFESGIGLGPKNVGLQDAILRLTKRAQDILNSAETSAAGAIAAAGPLPRSVCSHLQEVIAMTPADHVAHKRAQAHLPRCSERLKAVP